MSQRIKATYQQRLYEARQNASHPEGPWGRRTRKNVPNRARKLLLRWYKQTHPCVDCGEVDPVLLQFDHVPEKGPKCFILGSSVSRTLDELWTEIQKCEVRCSNCHITMTLIRRNGDDGLIHHYIVQNIDWFCT